MELTSKFRVVQARAFCAFRIVSALLDHCDESGVCAMDEIIHTYLHISMRNRWKRLADTWFAHVAELIQAHLSSAMPSPFSGSK